MRNNRYISWVLTCCCTLGIHLESSSLRHNQVILSEVSNKRLEIYKKQWDLLLTSANCVSSSIFTSKKTALSTSLSLRHSMLQLLRIHNISCNLGLSVWRGRHIHATGQRPRLTLFGLWFGRLLEPWPPKKYSLPLGILAHLVRWWARGVQSPPKRKVFTVGSMKPFSEGEPGSLKFPKIFFGGSQVTDESDEWWGPEIQSTTLWRVQKENS